MGNQNKYKVISFILAVALVLGTGIHASAKPKKSKPGTSADRVTVTGTVTGIEEAKGMKFLHLVSASGEDNWVAVFGNVPVVEGNEYTFEGYVKRNYRINILKRDFAEVIFSAGPQ